MLRASVCIPHRFGPLPLLTATAYKYKGGPPCPSCKAELRKSLVRCQECALVVHEQCALSVPPTCGMSPEVLNKFETSAARTNLNGGTSESRRAGMRRQPLTAIVARLL